MTLHRDVVARECHRLAGQAGPEEFIACVEAGGGERFDVVADSNGTQVGMVCHTTRGRHVWDLQCYPPSGALLIWESLASTTYDCKQKCLRVD